MELVGGSLKVKASHKKVKKMFFKKKETRNFKSQIFSILNKIEVPICNKSWYAIRNFIMLGI